MINYRDQQRFNIYYRKLLDNMATREKPAMTNEELQTAIDKAVEHYLTLRMKAHSMDHATRDEAHDHLVCLMKEQVQRATKDTAPTSPNAGSHF